MEGLHDSEDPGCAEEDLTAASARRLLELLEVEQATELCLDFVAVRRVDPGALGIVAEALQRRGLQVGLAGLSRQDVRSWRIWG